MPWAGRCGAWGPAAPQWRAPIAPSAISSGSRARSGSAIQFTAYVSPDGRGDPQALSTNEGATTLQYTALGRLKKATYPDAASEEFTYDLAGNRKTRRDAAAVGITYHYDAADQLTQISAGLVAGGAVLETFAHDDGGRRTRHTVGSAVTDYGYDGYGRLLKVTRTGYTADLTYTTLGRRAARSEGATTSRYPTSRFEQRGGSSYRLLRAGGFGSVVAEVQTPPTGPKVAYALQRDGSANVGHVFRTTGSSTTLEASPRRWTAFGTLRSGASVLERGYASQAQEGATGLILMGARHYDPATGRFLQPDPLGIEASELYAYAANNPYEFWDPSGLAPISLSGLLGNPLVTGSLQFAGGVAEAALGAAACTSGVGCTVGAVAFAHGVDHAFAGASTLYSGSSTQTYTSRGLEVTGVPSPYAGYADAAIGVFSGVGAGRFVAGLGLGFAQSGSVATGSLATAYRYVGAGEASIIEKTWLVPNVTRLGQPKNVSFTPLEFRSASQAEEALKIGRFDPRGPGITPTHGVEVNLRGVPLSYGGTGATGAGGVEVQTPAAVSALRIFELEP